MDSAHPVRMAPRDMSLQARTFGEELAKLLLDSPLPPEEKKAWAEMVPFMTPEQVQRFQDMLLHHAERQVFDEAEDIILAMKAAELQRQFALSHADARARKDMAKLEAEIDALEGTATYGE